MAPQTESPNTRKRKFPLLSTAHGSEMSTVVVGDGVDGRTFTIHKALLVQASSYFDRALHGSFVESAGTIKLKTHSPWAFEVLYQWLYSGQKLGPADVWNLSPPPRTDSHSCRMFWLRLFRLADHTLIHELKVHAYSHFIHTFDEQVPLSLLIDDMWSSESTPPVLKEFIVNVTAHHVLAGKGFLLAEVLKKFWSANQEYGIAVLNRLVDLAGTKPEARIRPRDDPRFHIDRAFPPPRARHGQRTSSPGIEILLHPKA